MDKADRVGQEELLASGHADAPHGCIQSSEEHIRLKDLPLIRFPFLHRFRRVLRQHGVHDRGLAGVGISDQRYQREPGILSLFSLGGALAANALELFGELTDAMINGAAVDLQLGLAFPLGGHGTRGAALTVLRLPHSDQAGLEVA